MSEGERASDGVSRKRPREEPIAGDSDGTPTSLTESRGSEPVDFLIVGAQKAGTMAAVKNLNK